MAALRVYASIIQHFQTVQNQVEEFDLCTGQVDVIWTFEKKSSLVLRCLLDIIYR